MADFLRVADGVAVESWSEPEGFVLAECFAPEVAETFHPKGEADVGWGWDGEAFAPPPPPPPPPEPEPPMDPVQKLAEFFAANPDVKALVCPAS